MADDIPSPSTYDVPLAEGTIKPNPKCLNDETRTEHLETMAKDMRKAIKGFGTDEYRIIRILTEHDNAQRQELIITYTTAFGRDLIDDLKDDLSGYFEELCLALLAKARLYDAICLHKAIKEGKSHWLIEILCPRTVDEIKELNSSYTELYGKSVEDEIRDATSGVFQNVLISMTTAGREQVPQANVDMEQVKKDAKDLYDAGEGKLGTDEETFNLIFAKRSWGHLREVFQEYLAISHKDIEDAIREEFSFNDKEAFLAIAKYAKNPAVYTAERLYGALDGMIDDVESFIRLVVAHSETDLALVKHAFRGMYGKTLEEYTKQECKGDFCKLLCRIIDPKGIIPRD